MTAARHQWKPGFIALLTIASLVALSPRASATERIVVDRHTGLAIGGFDPVAFFTERKPMLGSDQLELRFGGAGWRFCNPGNRAAFAAHPEVYMPRYGGYDPTAAARGVAVPGNPALWAITGERLYLFYSQAGRERFNADPERTIAAAERKWPDIVRTLTP